MLPPAVTNSVFTSVGAFGSLSFFLLHALNSNTRTISAIICFSFIFVVLFGENVCKDGNNFPKTNVRNYLFNCEKYLICHYRTK